MTRRQRRATFIGLGVGILSVAVLLVLFALRDSVVGFHLPKDIVTKEVPEGRRIRLGGLVAAGSVKREGLTVEFGITDTAATIPARYTGVLPDLFREGQGVVTEGKLDTNGRFIADTVLAKHDENYMPPEVARALKEQGMWQHTGPKEGSPSPRATPTSSPAPRALGEGRGEGQPHAPTSVPAAAPRPNPLPASGESGFGSPPQ